MLPDLLKLQQLHLPFCHTASRVPLSTAEPPEPSSFLEVLTGVAGGLGSGDRWPVCWL
jgi:hypothetical protein